MKQNTHESGFTAVEAALILVIIAILGFTGWFVYHARQSANKTLSQTSNSSATPAKVGTTQLVIKEWGVKTTVPNVGVTYRISQPQYFPGQVAWLSTASLDASEVCKAYYSFGGSDGLAQPLSFQGIERLASDQIVQADEGSPSVTATQAMAENQTEHTADKSVPLEYKRVGDYIFYYHHGNGSACKEQTAAQSSAFYAAFKNLQEN